MIARTRLPEGLLRLSWGQAGVLSRGQVLGFGVSDRVIARLTREERWQVITPGIYRLSEENWLQQAWAGILLGGEAAVLGGAAAAYLHGWRKTPPDPIPVFIPSNCRAHRDSRWQFVRSERSGRGEQPRTRAAQTVIDLAAASTADELTSLLAEAVAFGRLNPAEVLQLAADAPWLRNRRILNEALAAVSAGAMSPLEARYLTAVERAHGLPTASRQASPTGRYRTDGWYRSYGVIVELDGAAYHRGAARTVDLERDNLHRLNGLITLRFDWRLVTVTPCAVARQVAAALHQGGWQGTLRRCPRC